MESNLTQQVVKSEKVEIEQVSNSEPLKRLIAFAPSLLKNLAPDILEVALASLINPIAGIGLVTKRIADHQKITEAKVQQAAEVQFREKAVVYKEAYQNLIESDNLHKTARSLARETVFLAEDAVKIDDQALLPEVFELYRKSLKQLLSSTDEKPLPIKQ